MLAIPSPVDHVLGLVIHLGCPGILVLYIPVLHVFTCLYTSGYDDILGVGVKMSYACQGRDTISDIMSVQNM